MHTVDHPSARPTSVPFRGGPAPRRRSSLLTRVLLATLPSALLLAAPGAAQQRIARPTPLVFVPPTPDAKQPIRVELVQVRTTIGGRHARTSVEIVLANPNARALEGRVQFPLLDGQTVAGFALDIDGRLRDAVPVPKTKGRQVFEDIRRQQVDPALLEVTQGNSYAVRVYPIPAHGTRRVRLEIEQVLARASAETAEYRLPLAFDERIGRLDVQVRIDGAAARGVSATLGARRLEAAACGTATACIAYATSGAENVGPLAVLTRVDDRPYVVTSEHRGQTYFYVEVPADGALQSAVARPLPRRVAIVWDASGSGRDRDHAAELALLDAWFQRIGAARVELHVVRDSPAAPVAFDVQQGRWDDLRAHLERVAYDGATARLLWSQATDADLALVFTDGLANYGESAADASESDGSGESRRVATSVPTFAINASQRANPVALRLYAERSGGEAIDLARQPATEAIERLLRVRPRLVRAVGAAVRDVVISTPHAEDGRYAVAGVLTAPSSQLRLSFVDARGRSLERRVEVTHGPRWVASATALESASGSAAASASAPASPAGSPPTSLDAARQWARLRVESLSADEALNAATIERLGMAHGLATSRTSLIVLEAAADYARHGIEPPRAEPELVTAVAALVAAQRATETRSRSEQLARVEREFAEREQWWSTSFPKDTPSAKIAQARAELDMPASAARRSENMRMMLPAPAQAMARERENAMGAARAVASTRSDEMGATLADSAEPAGDAVPTATIRLRAWEPDSAYARRMRAAKSAADAYAIYLDERAGYANSTAFFLNAADILAAKGDTALATRVVSNLAELDLEDRHVLRILGYRLLQMQAPRFARPVFERVRDLAPDEPQSWRDLGLAHAALDETQAAVDALWHVVATPWHDRFPSIELVALGELNAIVARARAAGVAVDTSRIPESLRRNLPVALRVVLAWDADDTDIDLWITDPNGEKTYYGNRLSYQGGAMSRDFTGGYGPEEFVLRHAKPGRYRVQAHFYGHRQQVVAPSTTLMLALHTGFGTTEQKTQSVILRLGERSEVVDVGDFEVQ